MAVIVSALRQRSECRVAVQSVRAWYLVRRAGDMRCVVIAVTRLMVAIREDCQLWLRMGRYELWFYASIMERLLAGIEFEVEDLLCGSAQALSA